MIEIFPALGTSVGQDFETPNDPKEKTAGRGGFRAPCGTARDGNSMIHLGLEVADIPK